MRFYHKALIAILCWSLTLVAVAQSDRWIYIGRTTSHYIQGSPFLDHKQYESWYADRRTLERPKPGVIFVWIKMDSFSDESSPQTSDPSYTETWKVKIDSKRRVYQRLDEQGSVQQIPPGSMWEAVMDRFAK